MQALFRFGTPSTLSWHTAPARSALAGAARWGLPWLCAFGVSAGVAAAITAALPRGSSAWATPMSFAVAPRSSIEAGVDPSAGALAVASTTTLQAIDRSFSNAEACDMSGGRTLYVGLNTWIAAQPTVEPCPDSN
jgi:hypothetical protein